METIQIADGQIFLLLLRGLLVAAIPFAAFFRLRQKHGGRGFPVFVGVITVMLILLPRELFRNVLIKGAETDTGKWLTVWLVGAIFEECGRYVAMKHAIPNYDTVPDALCYGIGHGGTEVIMSARLQFVLLADALGQSGTPEHLAAISEQGILTALGVLLGNAGNLACHMGLSVLVMRAVHYEGCKKLLPLAVFLHMLGNFTDFCFGTAAEVMLTVLIWIFVYLHGKRLQEREFDAY